MKIHSCDKQNFQGARLKSQTFESFREYVLKNNFLENYPQLIRPENYINEGLSNKVYRIPDNPDFLLRVKKNPTPERNLGFGPVEDVFPDLNVGQEIARLNDDVTVVVAQKGEPCGFRRWAGSKMLPIQPEDKAQFIRYISTIAGFPLKAYENFIKEAQIVNKVKLIDIHNSQNVLYDTENNCFNIVDVSAKDRLRRMLSPMVLAAQLCDFRNLFSVLKMSDGNEQKIVFEAVSSIVKNVKQASKNNGLKPSIKPYLHKVYNLMKGKKMDEFITFIKFRLLCWKNN